MWPRVAELMLGLWLVLSPLIFRNTPSVGEVAVIDVTAGSLVVLMAILSFWRPTAGAHFVTIAIALGLGLYGYFGFERPGPPVAQNEITLALLLLLLAIIPNEANEPPVPWREAARRADGAPRTR